MNPGQIRVIDPILTNVAQGYRNGDMVGYNLFPRVPVQVAGGQIIEFGKESFRLYNTRRAPGGATKRIESGYLGKPYALENHALEATVPIELQRDAKAVPGIDLATRRLNLVLKVDALELEVQQAGLCLNPANYDSNHKLALSSATKWSADTGRPDLDVKEAKEAIRSAVGTYPNLLLLSAQAFNACQTNPEIKDRFKYTSSASITEDMLANYFQVAKVVVGKGVVDQGDGNGDIWGNNAVLAYVALGSLGAEEPSYGYTYTLEGNPYVKNPYFEDNSESWVYGVHHERMPVLSGILSGFLFQNPA
jgi:hypothetical protein